eukprot:COSAG05_NODE_1133_length_5773_cov_2.866584_3_plen_114_part_00
MATLICRAVPHTQRTLHPTQDRTLSVREVLAVSGFADEYVLRGSIKDQYQQVGNAVPPPLAVAIGNAICKAAAAKQQPSSSDCAASHSPVSRSNNVGSADYGHREASSMDCFT